MEQYLRSGQAVGTSFGEDLSCKSFASKLDEEEVNRGEGFECNICLDGVHDPVVTFCGHLYCWSCIYKWIISFSENPDETKPVCPVCKAEVSEKTLIPLYGRGRGTNVTNPSKTNVHLIPKRPASPLSVTDNIANIAPRFDHHLPDRSYMRPEQPQLTTASAPVVDPMIGVFGEMVYARIFGNAETTLYTYPNAEYHYTGEQQRRMTQVDRSLSRVCFFLCCCTLFCLLMF